MKENQIKYIVEKYLLGRFPKETEEKVQRWLIEDRQTEAKEKASLEVWNQLEAKTDADTYRSLKQVNEQIGRSDRKNTRMLYQKAGRVAAILIPLILLAGSFFYFAATRDNIQEIYAAYGEEKHLFLPDGSEVWINAGSTIKYPKTFSDKKRKVELYGEAYFSVQRDTSRPFVVQTEHIAVNVLGTKFNLKSYANEEQVVATLISGSIQVDTKTDQSSILLPNEQLALNTRTAEVTIRQVDAKEACAWTAGELIFMDVSFDEIIQTLERRFDVSFTIEQGIIQKEKRYTVKFIRQDSLEDILNVLMEVVGNFNYQQVDRSITITKR